MYKATNYIILCTPIRHDPLTREIKEIVVDYLYISTYNFVRVTGENQLPTAEMFLLTLYMIIIKLGPGFESKMHYILGSL